MRINSSVAAPAVARTAETKIAAETKPAVEGKPTTGLVARDEFQRGPGGCFPPFPHPLPPVFQPDAKSRATQAGQLDQISNGVRNGSVTAQEAERLLKEQQDIAAYQQKAMADGKLSKEEQLQLASMQAKAALNVYQASHNGDRNAFAKLDQNAQRQADQIGRLADGRRSGNITNSEAGELLGDQVEIADARGDADSVKERAELAGKLSAADRDINYHSKAGTQFHLKPFPHPLPFPRPTPLPLPRPLPLPELPRPLPFPEMPVHALPFKGVING